MALSPRMYWAVRTCRSRGTRPSARRKTISPPASPHPRSEINETVPAARIVGSCSTAAVSPDLLEQLRMRIEPLVVPGVEADTGLVARGRRGSQRAEARAAAVDPLSLAPGQRGRQIYPVKKVNMVKADFEQEPKGIRYLRRQALGHLALETVGRGSRGSMGLTTVSPGRTANPIPPTRTPRAWGLEPRLSAGGAERRTCGHGGAPRTWTLYFSIGAAAKIP